MTTNPLYEAFDELLSKEQLDYFLDKWWRLYPRIYKSLHFKAHGEAYKMLDLMMEAHPELFNSMMIKTLRM